MRWIPEATQPYNQAIVAFQSWERISRLGDEAATRRAFRVFHHADQNWNEVLVAMQSNANKHIDGLATPHKPRATGGSGDNTLALPHLQSIASSLASLVELKCLVRYTCVPYPFTLLTSLLGCPCPHHYLAS